MSSTVDALDLLRILFGLVFLCYASYSDFKTRRVRNEVWIFMGITGCVLLALQLFNENVRWEYFLIFIPIIILFASMFVEFEPLVDLEKKRVNFILLGLFIIGIAVVVFLISTLGEDVFFYQLLTIPIMILAFFALYQLRMLHGGADAKALMAIAILVPFHPHFLDFPMISFASERMTAAVELIPFAFLVLLNSVLFVVWIFVVLIIYNSAKGNFGFPEMLLGYKMDIDEVEKNFVWPMERIKDGERVMILFPKKTDSESLKELKERGVERIWVTPKIPFIVVLTMGFIISVFIGNVFFGVIFGLSG
jgi:preflagellin peptidase FlaK